MSEKASKGRFSTPERLQNHSNESKELKRKGDKERHRRKSRGLKKKAMIALFVFIIATLLDAKGPFSNNVIENPARYIIN